MELNSAKESSFNLDGVGSVLRGSGGGRFLFWFPPPRPDAEE